MRRPFAFANVKLTTGNASAPRRTRCRTNARPHHRPASSPAIARSRPRSGTRSRSLRDRQTRAVHWLAVPPLSRRRRRSASPSAGRRGQSSLPLWVRTFTVRARSWVSSHSKHSAFGRPCLNSCATCSHSPSDSPKARVLRLPSFSPASCSRGMECNNCSARSRALTSAALCSRRTATIANSRSSMETKRAVAFHPPKT
jgi:hypothetical protein